jgi:hypothetical protein
VPTEAVVLSTAFASAFSSDRLGLSVNALAIGDRVVVLDIGGQPQIVN